VESAGARASRSAQGPSQHAGPSSLAQQRWLLGQHAVRPAYEQVISSDRQPAVGGACSGSPYPAEARWLGRRTQYAAPEFSAQPSPNGQQIDCDEAVQYWYPFGHLPE